VREITADEAPWLALAENLQRVDLNPIEEAHAYQAMLATGVTQTLLGQRIGKSQSHIATKLRFLALVPDAQAAMIAGTLSEGQAKQLLRLQAPEPQTALCQQALAEHWTVMRLKQEVDVLSKPRPKSPQTPAELIISWWEKRGRIPGHDPYPEEDDPTRFDPPVDVRAIALTALRLPGAYGADDYRITRDPKYASWLAEILITLPPIAVFQDGPAFLVADGRYRLMAAEQLHHETIESRIYAPRGTIRGGKYAVSVAVEAWSYGVWQNSRQGIPYSQTDLQHILHRASVEYVT
jgi:HTH domain found in ParB protein